MSKTSSPARSSPNLNKSFMSSIITQVRNGSSTLLFPIYILGVVGAFLQIAGAQWDVSWHALGIVETFLTPAHAVLYAGIVTVAAAALLGLWFRPRMLAGNSISSSLFIGTIIAAVGSSLQIIAAPIDFWWHSTYGFDPYLFTPAHSLLIIGLFLGGAGMTLGTVRLLKVNRAGLYQVTSPRILSLIAVLGLATIWADLDFLGLYITDVRGMAYTFGYCSIQQFNANTCSFSNQAGLASVLSYIAILAAVGTFVFWGTKRLFTRRGVLTAVAAIIAALHAVASLGFIAYALEFLNPPGTFYITNPNPALGAEIASFIPVYLAFLIPVVLLDLSIKTQLRKGTMLAVSLLVGPFVALLDGRFASNLIGGLSPSFLFVIAVPTVVGGLVGVTIFRSSATKLLPRSILPQATNLGLPGRSS